jgi:hypothetical protein
MIDTPHMTYYRLLIPRTVLELTPYLEKKFQNMHFFSTAAAHSTSEIIWTYILRLKVVWDYCSVTLIVAKLLSNLHLVVVRFPGFMGSVFPVHRP